MSLNSFFGKLFCKKSVTSAAITTSNVQNDLKSLGISTADILLTKKNIDMTKWAVIACDQYSSEKEYWQSVSEIVGNNPSTLNIIFPECYLEDDDKETRIKNINETMNKYVSQNIFDTYKDCFILVKRNCADGKSRLGLMMCLDLEKYSYEKGSKMLIRATEGTIVDRIPPRKKIRKDAPLELPHIMVLINDKDRAIIEKLYSKKDSLQKVYDFKLMKDSGSISAWVVKDESDLKLVYKGFKNIYDNLDSNNKLLFAMGDGNHSFATAKSTWEDIKSTLSAEEIENNPARYCLVEVENIYDEGLLFEPIHRVFFNVEVETFDNELRSIDSNYVKKTAIDLKSAINEINSNSDKVSFVLEKNGINYVYSLDKQKAISAPNAIQKMIDEIVLNKHIGKIDYTHGIDSTISIASKGNNFAIIMPDISKDAFFDTILRGGAFPRKTFSMGEASEKRFYIEARKIK